MENDKTIEFDNSIDFGEAAVGAGVLADENWTPPDRVYFGKKLPNGRIERTPPPYSYQEFPRMLYKRIEGKARAKVVNTEAERDEALAEGWVKQPAELGIITCPSLEQAVAMKRAREATEPELQTETVEVVKRKPGRPKGS